MLWGKGGRRKKQPAERFKYSFEAPVSSNYAQPKLSQISSLCLTLLLALYWQVSPDIMSSQPLNNVLQISPPELTLLNGSTHCSKCRQKSNRYDTIGMPNRYDSPREALRGPWASLGGPQGGPQGGGIFGKIDIQSPVQNEGKCIKNPTCRRPSESTQEALNSL